MTEQLLIEEIITKECERYELEENGFVANRQAVVKELLSRQYPSLPAEESLEKFGEWKEHLLSDWYSQKGFAGFFRRKAEKRCMYRMVKRLLLNALSRIRKRQTEATLDDELKMEGGRTVAFKLSSAHFAELYQEMCCGSKLFASPGQLEQTCVDELRSLFPLQYASLYERLSAKDNEFWEEVWRLIYRFIRFLVTDKRGKEDEETIKEVSMETVLSVQEQLERGKLKPVESAAHLLNSLQMTGRNKCREWFRAEEKKKDEALFDEEYWSQLEQEDTGTPDSETESMDGRFGYLLEVDERSEYEVCCALVDVLNFGHGEVFDQLVEERKELARAMTMLYVENKQYEEIAAVLYGASDGRSLANLRKSVSRGKEYLKRRMAELIIIYKRKGSVPFVREIEEG